MSQEDQILELSALAPVREKARVRTKEDPDGTVFELAEPRDFGLNDLRKLTGWYAEAESLWTKDGDLTSAQERLLTQRLNQVTEKLLIDVPPRAAKALDLVPKRALAMRFFGGLGETMAASMGQMGQRLLDEPTLEN